jgi:hypothetical protein
MITTIESKDQWLLQRQGKFTASENWKLLVKGKDGKSFGVGAITYITQKAVECMTEYWENPKLEYAKPLLHGRAIEYQAFADYCDRTKNYEMEYFGTDNPRYFAYNDDSGGSPDAKMKDWTKHKWGAEIKCPFTPAVHFEHLQLKDQWALKDYSPEYYTQIQMLIMTTGADGWDFFSFDERYKDRKKRGKIITVEPDKKFIEALDIKIDMAVSERNRIINSLN